jgi:bacillithiol biosynthesis cysteine-adding enzyme BshC
MRDFLADYRAGAADLLACYATSPESLWSPPAETAAWPAGLADAVRAYNADRGHRPAFSGAEPVIITGQQPGLFIGPLYTIYKAITTLKLARLHADRTGLPTAPVFWVGADDHDFDEAASTCFLSRRHTVETLTYVPAADVAGQCMYRVPIEPALHQMSETLAADAPGSGDATAILQMLHDTLNDAHSFSDWTARLLARLFHDTPLILFTPELPVARRIAADVFRRELEDPLETTRRVNEAGKHLATLGFEPQVVKAAEECSFFLEVGGRRRKVIWENRVFFLPEADTKYSAAELRALLDTAPERFTANVALRCIIQQRLFPTRAYVAGPGELAYWAQLNAAFERHGLPMPVVYPRAQCLLTTVKLNKLRAKLGLSLEELAQSEEEAVTLAMQRAGAHPLLGRVQQAHQKTRGELDTLAKALDPSAPTAAQMLPAMLAELDRGFSRVERALLMADEAKHATIRQQVERLRHSLRPHRKPQERVFTVFSFLFEHGPGLINQLLKEIDPELIQVQEVEL